MLNKYISLLLLKIWVPVKTLKVGLEMIKVRIIRRKKFSQSYCF